MPTVAETLALALRYHQAGDLGRAEQLYHAILGADPGQADAMHYLGVLHFQAGRHDQAVETIRAALCLQPAMPAAYNHLGLALKARGELAEAVASFRHALVLQPDLAAAHGNLGVALLAQAQAEEAAACFREAVRLGQSAGDYHNLSLALTELDELAGAEAAAREALRRQPNYAEVHDQLGRVLRLRGRLDEAAAAYEQAIALQPDAAGAHFNLSAIRLLQGDFARGWREFEWRLRTREFALPPLAGPWWDGGPLGGKTILLYADQGMGDALQFVRYAPLVQQRGGRVVLACAASLLPLLRGAAGVDAVVDRRGPLPAYDVHAALLSLPALFGTTLASIPGPSPYLLGDPARVAGWRERLAAPRTLTVGICWQGNPDHQNDRRRSVALAEFAPLADVPGVRLVSLQFGPAQAQLAEQTVPVTESLGQDEPPPWDETAALVGALDLVITVDTAVAHLAGALGVPTWIALPTTVDWRWLLDRDDSPWYPSVRLFRQTTSGDWSGVFERLRVALQKKAVDA